MGKDFGKQWLREDDVSLREMCKIKLIFWTWHFNVALKVLVQCTFFQVREQWLPFRQGNPVQIEGDLDIEFAISDQVHLNREMGLRMKRGIMKPWEKWNYIPLTLGVLEKFIHTSVNLQLKVSGLFKDTINPYYCLLKNANFSVKKSND